MGTTVEIVKDFLGDLTRFVRLGSPQTYKELTFVPLLMKDEHVLDMISLRKGEETGTAYIQECSGGASVSALEVVNQGSKPVLLPFMQTITGGQQDRTVIEPILVPVGQHAETPLVIPVRCIESGRWVTRGAPDLDIQHSTGAEVSVPHARRFRVARMKASPSLNYRIMEHSKAQGAVWDSIESYSRQMSISVAEAPSRSYLHMQRAKDSEIKEYAESSEFKEQTGQCGVVALVGTQVVGMELYGNAECWKDFRTEVLNGFASEVLLRKDETQEKLDPVDAHETVLTAFDAEMEFVERTGTGIGTVVEFHSSNRAWYGISLIQAGRPAHFYMAYRSVLDPSSAGPTPQRLQSTMLNREIQQMRLTPEVPSQLDPRAFPPEEEP